MDEARTPYDAEHIRDALIHDPRVNELPAGKAPADDERDLVPPAD